MCATDVPESRAPWSWGHGVCVPGGVPGPTRAVRVARRPDLCAWPPSRYLFALQLKRDLLEERLTCTDATAALLASHLLQCECPREAVSAAFL